MLVILFCRLNILLGASSLLGSEEIVWYLHWIGLIAQ